MSIELQANFWLQNVNDYARAGDERDALADGFRQFSALLREIFGDYASFEVSAAESIVTKIGIMADDLENYHILTETLDCLYQMAALGAPGEEGGVRYLNVKKADLRREFKGSATFPLQMLERHGFSYRFLKGEREARDYKSCDALYLFYEGGAELIPAMKALADSLPDTTAKEDYAAKRFLFYMADYECSQRGASANQTAVSPLKPGILGTAGEKGALWREIAGELYGRWNLDCKASINPYVFPNWTVKFLRKKRTIITFTIRPNQLYVKLPLPYELAKRVIGRRNELPRIIGESVGRFGCIGCGKCANQSNIELYLGVKLCRLNMTSFLTEDSRSIGGELADLEEAQVICGLAEEIAG